MKAPPPSAPVEDAVHTVDLEVDKASGLTFTGSPPKISAVLRDDPLWQGQNSPVGCYVMALQLPGVEISGFRDASTLQQVLEGHLRVSNYRLVISTYPPTDSGDQGLLYRHDLPTDQDLGITFDGFPAKIATVDKLSLFYGRIVPGQFVEAVVVPGSADLKFESGGFTGHRVAQYLTETANVVGRRLVIANVPLNPPNRPGYTKFDQSDPFDFGGFVGNWFRRQRTTPPKEKF